MPILDELLAVLGNVGGTITVVFVVALFITMAALLWSWRKIAFGEEEG
jgi:type IV secretory pathway VirB2 component (pilin)